MKIEGNEIIAIDKANNKFVDIAIIGIQPFGEEDGSIYYQLDDNEEMTAFIRETKSSFDRKYLIEKIKCKIDDIKRMKMFLFNVCFCEGITCPPSMTLHESEWDYMRKGVLETLEDLKKFVEIMDNLKPQKGMEGYKTT